MLPEDPSVAEDPAMALSQLGVDAGSHETARDLAR